MTIYQSIGWNCNTTGFLEKYNLKSLNSPFEWMFIDFQTVMENIRDKFKDFISKISFTKPIFSHMDEPLGNLRCNINFCDITSNDIIEWNRICIFHHHPLETDVGLSNMVRRINRFLSLNPKETTLIYMTKPVSDYMKIIDEYSKIAVPDYNVIVIIHYDKEIRTSCIERENVKYIVKSYLTAEELKIYRKKNNWNFPEIDYGDVMEYVR
jgi:hypothetical protein